MKQQNILEEFIFPVVPPHFIAMLTAVSDFPIKEIRLRINRPIVLVLGESDIMLSPLGGVVTEEQAAYQCTREDINKILQLISKNSLYAFEQELKMGFITIHGGHRVGLAGQGILDGGEIKALKNISSLNIRMAREVKGCADPIIPYLFDKEKRVLNALLISPPCCGKTTLLRDVIRQISIGNKECRGLQVGVVDERSEIAACKNGIPTVDLGMRTDVLDACPKASGMLMLIRSMSPALVATDELGRKEDITAVREALHAGVAVLATIHGRDVEEIKERPYVKELIEGNYFERYIILTDYPKVGTVEKIISAKDNKVLWSRPLL